MRFPPILPRRPGFYVEGQFYQDRYHQAHARARFLTGLYGRLVTVERVEHEEILTSNGWSDVFLRMVNREIRDLNPKPSQNPELDRWVRWVNENRNIRDIDIT